MNAFYDLDNCSNNIAIIPSAINAIAVPIKSVLTELKRKAGCSQNLMNRVTNGITNHVKIEDVIRLFTNIELAGDQDCMIPKAANTLDCVMTVGYNPRTTDKTCFHAGRPKLVFSIPDWRENHPSKPVVNDLNL